MSQDGWIIHFGQTRTDICRAVRWSSVTPRGTEGASHRKSPLTLDLPAEARLSPGGLSVVADCVRALLQGAVGSTHPDALLGLIFYLLVILSLPAPAPMALLTHGLNLFALTPAPPWRPLPDLSPQALAPPTSPTPVLQPLAHTWRGVVVDFGKTTCKNSTFAQGGLSLPASSLWVWGRQPSLYASGAPLRGGFQERVWRGCE